jgi:hypothetical protein
MFRHADIKISLCSKYDRIFNNIMANGQYVWYPFLGVLVDNDNGDDVDNGDDDAYLEEGSGDLDKDVIPNFIEDVSNMESNNNT